MPPDLGPVPLDDDALTAIEHALTATYTHDDEGQPQITDADYNLPQLLDFWSGHDRVDDVLVDEWAGTKVYERTKPSYSERDLLRALVAEVRRLRLLAPQIHVPDVELGLDPHPVSLCEPERCGCLCLLFDPSDNDEETCACGHPIHHHANDAGKCQAAS